MKTIATIVALLVATAAHAHVFNPPEPPIPDNWPPPCQSIALRGPDASFESRQRRKLARALLGYPTCPIGCHFVLIATPENPNPAYRARNLGLSCKFRDDGWLLFPWPKAPAGR